MFVKAIETAVEFTRPMHTIMRRYGSHEIEPGCSSFILINDEGFAITCKHVIEGLVSPCDTINAQYAQFREELNSIPMNGKRKRLIANLENKYGYKKGETVVQISNNFCDAVDKSTQICWWCHPIYDLAIVKFEGFSQVFCNRFPVFAKDGNNARQGKSLCRLGFPYPEFSNYKYDEKCDEIIWTAENRMQSPRFPIDGIITRFACDDKGVVSEIEMSTPGLKGQSGGPLFDTNGVIYGIQSNTISLPLGFDQIDREILINGRKKKVNDYSFIHLGRCVHVNIIKEFLDQHRVKYNIEP